MLEHDSDSEVIDSMVMTPNNNNNHNNTYNNRKKGQSKTATITALLLRGPRHY